MNLNTSPFFAVTIGFFSATVFAHAIWGQTADSTPAQAPTSQVDQAGQGLSEIKFKALRTVRVKHGSHSIFYNLVTPPVLPVPTPTTQPVASGTDTAPELSQKACQSIFFSATVYDRQITDIRWFNGDQSFRAFSNIDFNYFGGNMRFETADTVYFYVMSLDNETTTSADTATRSLLAQARQQLPTLSPLKNTPSSYVVVGNPSFGNSSACSILDAMHAYYDANQGQLISAYQTRIADEVAQAKQLREHPPVQRDTVINFWRIKNSAPVNSGN